MSHKVLITDPLAPQGLERLSAYADLEVDLRPGLAPEELVRHIPPYHGLIIRSGTRVTREALAAAANLRVVGRAGIGVDNVDVEAATKRGVVVMNTPGGNNVTTAEHALSLLFALARNVPQANASLKAGRWEREKFTGSEISNKVLGVIGLGNIGAIVAERALGLRMRVVAYDPFVAPEAAAKLRVELAGLDELYARADFITVHTPLTKETRGLIGAAAFAKMKKGVRIINCARGGIVDEEALLHALNSGKVAGAALDVFVHEPPPPTHPLLQLEQVICTPHLGAATDEAQINVAVAIADQVASFLTRGVIQNAVNFPALTPKMLEILQPYLVLGEKLGSFLAQITPEAPLEVQVEYSGEIVEYDTAPATAAVLRGLLSPFLDSAVNYVNAPHIARERGLRIVESRSSRPSDFLNAVVVRVVGATVANVVEGAVFSNKAVRVVRVNDFYLEAVPEGYILVLHNRDVPGVVGAVGTLLGQRGINIAGLELGRERVGGMAISLIHVDGQVPAAVLAELRTLEPIVSAQLIRL
ncbi:MAG TPA: phosphoglycerate dehydrogenase [Candidatus Binatia bacterium]|nr:phosphoglycerate dehydrogenase [Candidatus Binatia bacterium]